MALALRDGMKLTFERRGPCPRCNGSKVFRCWSHIANGRCFKCNGVGYTLTKRGALAADAWAASDRAETLAEITAGYRVQAGVSARWHTITSVEAITAENTGAWTVSPDGARVPCVGVRVTVRGSAVTP